MHLGLTDEPFVPHNLKSAQDSPVPLPKLQTPPRHKILMSSGSKKGTQICFPLLSKSPGKRIPSRFPIGAPVERDTRLHGIFTYLFISKAQRKERPSVLPTSAAPMETDAHSRALLSISFGFPSKGALSPGPPHGVPSERDVPFLEPSFIHHSKSPGHEPPPDSREMSVSGAFHYISIYVCRVPKKGALLQNGQKHTVTVHGAPCRRKAYIQRGAAWFPKGIVNDTAISTPVSCSPRHDTFHLGLDRSEPR